MPEILFQSCALQAIHSCIFWCSFKKPICSKTEVAGDLKEHLPGNQNYGGIALQLRNMKHCSPHKVLSFKRLLFSDGGNVILRRFIDNGFGICECTKREVEYWIEQFNSLRKSIAIDKCSFVANWSFWI